MKKECKACNEEKDLSEFYRDRTLSDGRANTCIKCKKADNSRRYRGYRKYVSRNEPVEPFDPDLELKRRAENWVKIFGKEAVYAKARLI